MKKIKSIFFKSNLLIRLIYINIAVFLAVNLLDIFYFLFNFKSAQNFIIEYFSVPSSINKLLFRIWTPISYMFLHEDFLHILFNMLWLYWFGKIFLHLFDEKKLLTVYIYSGLSGAFLYILSFNIFPVFHETLIFSRALGASASVLGIVIASAIYRPNISLRFLFIGDIKIKYIAIFSVLLDILRINSENSGGHIAHLGGAIFAYFFIKKLEKGEDISVKFNLFFDKFLYFFIKKTSFKGSKNRDFKYSKNKDFNSFSQDNLELNEKNIDKILDKIKETGYTSLNKKEKELLFKMKNN
ncbi:MAG: hypothetical protein B6I24_05725 [Bacteroidetes bacterium 4572_128]|nr:MAG: hypothetical protein B6I24_05725 [Bacteroidetes bacterium 4572_128]